MFNGVGQTYVETKNALKGAEACESNRIESLNTIKYYIMGLAMGILSLLIFIMGFYVLSADSSLNILWENLRKKLHSSYYDIRQVFSLKYGRVVILLTGRFAGKKAVIIKCSEEGTKVLISPLTILRTENTDTQSWQASSNTHEKSQRR